MKTVVVYESLWGNTAAIARAIAEGIGHGAHALSTAEASGTVIAEAELIVVGAPVLGFNLPDEKMRENIHVNPGQAPAPPNLSHPSVRSWLAVLPKGNGRSAAFETRLWWSPGGATTAISRGLEKAGYTLLTKPQRFIVTGAYGPLRAGELDRARKWGTELAHLINQSGNARS
jgi:hypothetical protein